MSGPSVRCPACGHPLFTVDEPAWFAGSRRDAPTAPNAPLLLGISKAAELLGLSRSTLYQLVGTGRVRVIRIGRSVRIPRQELERLANEGLD